jgi:hypothetical protein
LKNAVFWHVVPYRYFVNRCFGGTYHLHLQGVRNPREMNQRERGHMGRHKRGEGKGLGRDGLTGSRPGQILILLGGKKAGILGEH